MNDAILVLTGALTILGVGYFCVDWSRNRSKRLSHFEAIADVTGLQLGDSSLQKENEIAQHAVHTLGDGVGHCVEADSGCAAIAHTLSHH
jgi:hypothetical protein